MKSKIISDSIECVFDVVAGATKNQKHNKNIQTKKLNIKEINNNEYIKEI